LPNDPLERPNNNRHARESGHRAARWRGDALDSRSRGMTNSGRIGNSLAGPGRRKVRVCCISAGDAWAPRWKLTRRTPEHRLAAPMRWKAICMSSQRLKRGRRIERTVSLIAALVAAILAVGSAMAAQDGGPPRGPHLLQRCGEVAAPGAGGMLIYRDPETGSFAVPPPEVARDLAPAPLPAGHSAALDEVPGGTPAGGMKIDLRGQRFTVIEKVKPGGALSARCTGPVYDADR